MSGKSSDSQYSAQPYVTHNPREITGAGLNVSRTTDHSQVSGGAYHGQNATVIYGSGSHSVSENSDVKISASRDSNGRINASAGWGYNF